MQLLPCQTFVRRCCHDYVRACSCDIGGWQSLSVDNLFVFLMLFEYFKVPEQYTERVLRWGIMSALVLRGVMIAVGVAAVQRFRPVLLAFALILVVSAWKMISEGDEDEDLKDNMVRTPWRNAHRCATECH